MQVLHRNQRNEKQIIGILPKGPKRGAEAVPAGNKNIVVLFLPVTRTSLMATGLLVKVCPSDSSAYFPSKDTNFSLSCRHKALFK